MLAWCATCAPLIADLAKNYDDQRPFSATAMASQSAIATLFPGYFALVMATGIISLAAHFLGLTHIAQVLFWVNMTAYVVLWVLTVLRLVYYRAQLIMT